MEAVSTRADTVSEELVRGWVGGGKVRRVRPTPRRVGGGGCRGERGGGRAAVEPPPLGPDEKGETVTHHDDLKPRAPKNAGTPKEAFLSVSLPSSLPPGAARPEPVQEKRRRAGKKRVPFARSSS